MLNTAFAPWPSFTAEEIDAVAAVLRSNRVNYWTGEEGRNFEREFADWSESAHAIAVANGTVALDLALHGLCIGAANGGSSADEVIVTPRTFLASASSVANAGAVPVFADVEPDSGNISAATMASVLTDRTRAFIAVHLAGWPADMDSIMDLASTRGIKVIEDCAQAHGARYKGRSVGSIGHVGAWSFCQDKIMTTGGEGGMVTCNDRELWARMWSFKDHGKSWDAVYDRKHPPGFRWLHESFGTNWRLTEMQAAIGRIQLRRMSEWTLARNTNASVLREAVRPFSHEKGIIRIADDWAQLQRSSSSDEDTVHAFYKFYIYVRTQNLADGWSRDRIVSEIGDLGVPCFQGSCSEIYLEKAFDGMGWRPGHALLCARALGETSLMFLVHPTLSDKDLEAAVAAIRDVLGQASGTAALTASSHQSLPPEARLR